MGSHITDAQNFTPRSGPRIALATLVLDCPALDDAPRGTGVLVSDDVREVRAKALTHSSAKWAWVAREAGEHRHVVRLSYGRTTPKGTGASPEVALEDRHLISLALGDASTLLGVPIEPAQLVGADVVRWHAALPRTDAGHSARAAGFRRALKDVPDAVAVGAWLSGTGLAAVVTDTRQQVRNLLARHGYDVAT